VAVAPQAKILSWASKIGGYFFDLVQCFALEMSCFLAIGIVFSCLKEQSFMTE